MLNLIGKIHKYESNFSLATENLKINFVHTSWTDSLVRKLDAYFSTHLL